MDCMYKGSGQAREGGVGDAGRCAARGWLYLLIGLFGIAMCSRSASHRPRQA